MKALLVVTDNYGLDCKKAFEFLKRFLREGDGVEVLGVLEGVYLLEKTSVSLGMPVPPSAKEEAKERLVKRVRAFWDEIIGTAPPEPEVCVGPLAEELKKFTEGKRYDLVVFACYPASGLCKVVDELEANSLIIK
ncbi:MAG: universal stress protein [Aquificae bacterium]|nr:universal stress protein [Aquificota bacterium]